MSKPKFIYVLPEYSNTNNLINTRSQTQDEYRIEFSKDKVHIVLTETNSLIEDEYCLHLQSVKFTLESEKKESMIHHHKKGHADKHLQFKLYSKGEEIRIFLEKLDDEDYHNCIQGFLFITKEILLREQEINKIEEDVVHHFFNNKIEQLALKKEFLLEKIKDASSHQKILNTHNNPLNTHDIQKLQSEHHLRLFLEKLS